MEVQHAVVEYSDQEQCFVLQDLNTPQGTFVNDCRVQNAAVRLAPGDLIRFGADTASYELQVENVSQVGDKFPVTKSQILVCINLVRERFFPRDSLGPELKRRWTIEKLQLGWGSLHFFAVLHSQILSLSHSSITLNS